MVQNLQKVLANRFSATNLLSKDILCGNLRKYMVQKFSSHLKEKATAIPSFYSEIFNICVKVKKDDLQIINTIHSKFQEISNVLNPFS